METLDVITTILGAGLFRGYTSTITVKPTNHRSSSQVAEAFDAFFKATTSTGSLGIGFMWGVIEGIAISLTYPLLGAYIGHYKYAAYPIYVSLLYIIKRIHGLFKSGKN